ncbi:MAG TPA: IPT/TIG domain-containing protein [Solirubrobacteraceae bacterium]|nr:IPT/TIG domain-containing protein [Solirubrobacteraceae bacterium]
MGQFKLFGAATLALIALGAGAAGPASALQLSSEPGAPLLASSGPAVLSVTPDEGPSAGGTKVTILGERFAGATTVAFGSTVVTLKKPSKSQTKIKVVAPAAAGLGTVDVTVTSPEGTSEATPADEFTYTSSPPAVGKLSPNHGPAVGGKSISVNGENLAGATEVRFGSQSVPFTVKSARDIKATVPPATAIGAVDVTVTTPEGTSAIVPADEYTYEAEFPAVEDLSPGSGPATGGTTISVKGEGFIGVSKVDFEGIPAASFEFVNDGEIIAVSPEHSVRKVSITVTTPEGTSPATCPGRTCKPVPKFEFDHPTVTSVEPKSGPVAGGTPITITGTGFATGKEETLIQIGKAYATSVHCSSFTTCTGITGAAKKAGASSVIVRIRTNVGEASEPNPEAIFNYE